jgi:hypothetical protein
VHDVRVDDTASAPRRAFLAARSAEASSTLSVPDASNAAVLSIVLALVAVSSVLLGAAAVPPRIYPWRSVAILFSQRRIAVAIYGFTVLLVAGLAYAMSGFSP